MRPPERIMVSPVAPRRSSGRSAGWLAYGAAIAGEASLVVSVEDIHGPYRLEEETTDPATGETKVRPIMNVEAVIKRIVKTMRVREEQEGKQYGVIVMAEGLAEYLPQDHLANILANMKPEPAPTPAPGQVEAPTR